jgi:broad specificity phosphatase PhoE
MLLIARHGNTFEADEKPRRVGARTDLDLTETGHAQSRALGLYLKSKNLVPQKIFVSELKRTQQTASGLLQTLNISRPFEISNLLNEIDYGIDENKNEDDVLARIGSEALKDWDQKNIVPQGWLVDLKQIQETWRHFAALAEQELILVITSNGIAKFAPDLCVKTSDPVVSTKMKTGHLSGLEFEDGSWRISFWNINPALA